MQGLDVNRLTLPGSMLNDKFCLQIMLHIDGYRSLIELLCDISKRKSKADKPFP